MERWALFQKKNNAFKHILEIAAHELNIFKTSIALKKLTIFRAPSKRNKL